MILAKPNVPHLRPALADVQRLVIALRALVLPSQVHVQHVHEQLPTLMRNRLVALAVGRIEEVYHALPTPDRQRVRGEGQILRLLQRIALQKAEADIPNGCDVAIVRVASWV